MEEDKTIPMKKLLLLFLILSFANAFSQEYHFDYKCYDVETHLRGRYKGNTRNNIIYFSSENKDFIAYDYSFSGETERTFLLDDYAKNKLYTYSINQNSNFSSLKLKKVFPIKVYQDEIKIERVEVENNGGNLYTVKTYPKNKSKEANLELKILVEKIGFSAPRIRFMDLTPNIHSKIYNALFSKLDSDNYRIIHAEIDYKNGVIMTNDFSKCEKINVKIVTGENSVL